MQFKCEWLTWDRLQLTEKSSGQVSSQVLKYYPSRSQVKSQINRDKYKSNPKFWQSRAEVRLKAVKACLKSILKSIETNPSQVLKYYPSRSQVKSQVNWDKSKSSLKAIKTSLSQISSLVKVCLKSIETSQNQVNGLSTSCRVGGLNPGSICPHVECLWGNCFGWSAQRLTWQLSPFKAGFKSDRCK